MTDEHRHHQASRQSAANGFHRHPQHDLGDACVLAAWRCCSGRNVLSVYCIWHPSATEFAANSPNPLEQSLVHFFYLAENQAYLTTLRGQKTGKVVGLGMPLFSPTRDPLRPRE
jgi:hypothetical protein